MSTMRTILNQDGRDTTHLHFDLEDGSYDNYFMRATLQSTGETVMTFTDRSSAAHLIDLDDALDVDKDYTDAEDVAFQLEEFGVDCTVDDSTPAYPICEIPGYGGIWCDDGAQSKNPGWVWESLERDESDAIDSEDLLDDLIELIDMANK